MTGSDQSRRLWFPCLFGLATLLFVTLLWCGAALPPSAYAQVPDSGAQRIEMIQQQRITNQKLGEIVKLLTEIRDRQQAAQPAKRDERGQTQRAKQQPK